MPTLQTLMGMTQRNGTPGARTNHSNESSSMLIRTTDGLERYLKEIYAIEKQIANGDN